MSTMTIFRRTGLAAAPLALALAVGGMTTASAATQAPTGVEGSKAVACASPGLSAGPTTNMTQVDGQRARNLTRAALDEVKSGGLATHAPRPALSFGQAKVYSVDSDGPAYSSVTVPISGGYSMVSNLTVLFNDSGEITQSGETLISENEAGNFNISKFTDGELVKGKDTNRPFMTDAQLRQDAQRGAAGADTVAAQGAGSTVACVAAVLGVSGAVAYLIVGACAGACTVPVVGTAICVACIGAYAAVGGSSIAAVASCF